VTRAGLTRAGLTSVGRLGNLRRTIGALGTVAVLCASMAPAAAGALRPARSPSAPRSVGPSVIAQTKGSMLSLFRSPSATKPFAVLNRTVGSGTPQVFLVSDATLAPYWLRIYLPSRPNESQAWVHASAVTLSSDPFRVAVDLSSHRLVVFDGSATRMTAVVGDGRPGLPTPTGTFYLVDLFRQSDASGEYGPFAFGLSAFSDVLESFGGGPGEIGLHGTNEPDSVGASLSHGCLRVQDATITALARLLPLGTPVVISQ
jgi:lipoprotein-anchoring transpeptidase ErfK/SrfK